MSEIPIAYVNGNYTAADAACVSPLDRGFLFGDGIYEVIPVFNGKLFLFEEHIQRLRQGLKAIGMEDPHSLAEWREICDTLIQRNHLGEQWLYLQVTRGFELVRNLEFPKNPNPTCFAISYPKKSAIKDEISRGIKITTATDIRWKHCHIKTTARIAYVLMYQEAKQNGFDEAIIIANGCAIEGTSSNIFIVRHGVIITPPKSSLMLSGITRDFILSIAERYKIPYREHKIAERDLMKADEIWISSSTRGIVPVIALDSQVVSQGIAGPLWNQVWDLYAKEIAEFSL